MTHLPHLLDTSVVAVTTLATVTSAAVLGSAITAEQSAELQLLLLPFIGALVMSGGIIMLNPQPETRRITMGRGIVALFFGVLGPQLIGLVHPSLAGLSVKPAVLIMSGGLIACLAYVLSRPFFAQLYRRAEHIAAREADRLERRLSPPAEPPTRRL